MSPPSPWPPPPRRPAWSVLINLLFRPRPVQIAWALLFGFVGMFYAATVESEAATLLEFRGPVATTRGEVVAKSVRSVQDTEYPELSFRYAVGETQHRAESYSPDETKLEIGDRVTVEYLVSRPAVARIQGLRRRPAPWGALFFGLLPLACLGLLLRFARLALWQRRLLRHGRAALGQVSVEPTADKTPISEETAMAGLHRVTFSFSDSEAGPDDYRTGQRSRQAQMLSFDTKTLGADREQRVIFDPARPKEALLVEGLPGVIDLEGDTVVATSSSVVVMLVPLGTLLVHGLLLGWFYWSLTR